MKRVLTLIVLILSLSSCADEGATPSTTVSTYENTDGSSVMCYTLNEQRYCSFIIEK